MGEQPKAGMTMPDVLAVTRLGGRDLSLEDERVRVSLVMR